MKATQTRGFAGFGALDPVFDEAGAAWNVDPNLVRAVAMQESGGNTRARSKAGAQGLMQIIPETQKYLGVTDPHDPVQAIWGGAKYLSEGLDREGSPAGALLFYHDGPDWRNAYGPESAGYVPGVTAKLQQIVARQGSGGGRQGTAPQQVPAKASAAPQQATPNYDDFLKRTGAGSPNREAIAAEAETAPAPEAAAKKEGGASGYDDFLKRTGAVEELPAPAAPASAPPGGTTARGLARNAAAGVVDASAGAVNVASNPIGNLVGKPLATGLVFAHDALAPVFGYDRFDEGTRSFLLGDNVPQPGNKLTAAIGGVVGVDPAAVPANSEAERLTRAGVAGAGTMVLLGPAGAAGPAMGAGGAVAGHLAGEAAPDWAKPAAELAGNVAGGAAAGAGLAGARVAGNFATNKLAAVAETPLRDLVRGVPINKLASIATDELRAAAQRAAAPRGAWTEEVPRFSPQPGSASERFATAEAATEQGGRNLLPIAPEVGEAGAAAQAVPGMLPAPPRPLVMAEPLPPPGGPRPNAAGAQASTAAEAAMTPAQVQAYRSTAEGQKLLEPQQPGVRDVNAYVPGVNPSLAEREQSVNTSRELKARNLSSPAVSEEARAIAARHNEARQQFFADIAGSDVDVANAKAARAAQAEADLAATWANKGQANAQPLMDLAAEIRASPDGRRPVVRRALDNITDELADADGNLLTDPEQLYGVRKHVDDLMSKEAGAEDPKSVRAMAAMGRMKEALDAVIEPAAPGFRQYLDNFSAASRPIEAMEVLQKHENRLFDAQSQMGYNKVQTMMRQIVDSRAAPGINPYKSLTEEQMQRLWGLRDDLRRSASAQELARTPGSDTAQNLRDAAMGIGKLAGEGALHGGAAMIAPGVGNAAVWIGKNALSPILAARRARRETARGLQILNPDPSELRNPYQD